MVSPFNSILQRSCTVVVNPNRPNTVTVYLKGAPETVLDMCFTYQTHDGPVEMTPDAGERI